jgi:hypothetical protein
MGKWVFIPWVGYQNTMDRGSIYMYHGKGGQNTMGRGWIYHGKGLDIP